MSTPADAAVATGSLRRATITTPGLDAPPPVRRSRLRGLIADLSLTLLNLPERDLARGVEAALRKTASCCGVDRCVVFRFSEDGRLMTKTHVVETDRQAPPKNGAKLLTCSKFPLWIEPIQNGHEIYVPRASDIPEVMEPWLAHLHGDGVQSFVLLPMMRGETSVGLLGLFSVLAPRSWTAADLQLLRGVGGIFANALRRGQTERALKDAEQNLQALLDNLDDYLFILDPAGRVLHANPQARQRLGYEQQELRRMTVCEVFAMNTRAEATAFLDERRQDTTTMVPLVTADGTLVAVETRLTRGAWNQHEVVYVICRDVTDRERALEGLRRFEKRTSAILDAIPDAMLRLHRNGSILDFTPGDLASPGGVAHLLGDNLAPALALACRKGTVKALQSGEMQELELELTTTSGPRTFESRLVVMGEDEVLASVRDISDRARLEQMKADFINRASHELRTPLTTALLMVDLIREGGEEDELAEYWQILRLELQRQHELVEDLLTVGRLETGRMRINLIPLDLAPVLRQAVDHTRRLASARRQELLCEAPKTLPEVNADGTALERVFANLVENAVKFTPAGGRVTARVSGEDDGVRVQVEDNGIGIPPEELSQLFDRFFRASNAVRAEIQGTGVGLYIVKSIVDAHNGTVSVRSAVDQGTTFDVWFPLTDSVAAADGAEDMPAA